MAWWERLTQREKIIITLGAIFLSIVVFVIFIFQPLSIAVSNAKNDNNSAQQNLQWMEHAVPRYQQLRAQGFLTSTVQVKSLLALAERTLAKRKLSSYVVSVQSATSRQVQLSFKGVPFDALIAWQEWLFHHFGVTIRQFSAHAGSQSGVVNAQVTLRISSVL